MTHLPNRNPCCNKSSIPRWYLWKLKFETILPWNSAWIPPLEIVVLLIWAVAWESGVLKSAQVFLMFNRFRDSCLTVSSKASGKVPSAFLFNWVDQPHLCLMISDLLFNLQWTLFASHLRERLPVINLERGHHFSSFSKTLLEGLVTDKTGNTAQPKTHYVRIGSFIKWKQRCCL